MKHKMATEVEEHLNQLNRMRHPVTDSLVFPPDPGHPLKTLGLPTRIRPEETGLPGLLASITCKQFP